jgi:putative ABC transport system substrate-binding protein
MERRTFIGGLAAGIALAPLPGRAQPAGRVWRLGVLVPTVPVSTGQFGFYTQLAAKLKAIGYAEPGNLVFEWRYAQGKPERLPALAKELVKRGVDAIVAVGGSATRAAKAATSTIPIVMYGSFDPVGEGYVASLERPGGNVTGVLLAPEDALGAKRFDLLHEAVPRATRIVFLAPTDPGTTAHQFQEVEQAATAHGIAVTAVRVKGSDYAGAFKAIAAARAEAVYVAATVSFVRDRKPIIDLATKNRLPTMWEWREQVEEGGLMAYGTSLAWMAEHIAAKLARIFKGEAPGTMPVEQANKFELALNLKTAAAIGVTLPPALVARADAVVR